MSEKSRFRRIPRSRMIWNSSGGNTYIKKKHGPIGKDLENYQEAEKQILQDIKDGKISNDKYGND